MNQLMKECRVIASFAIEPFPCQHTHLICGRGIKGTGHAMAGGCGILATISAGLTATPAIGSVAASSLRWMRVINAPSTKTVRKPVVVDFLTSYRSMTKARKVSIADAGKRITEDGPLHSHS